MKVVSPYRPFAPESDEHQSLGVFDWIGALEMLRASVRHSMSIETYAITDVDAQLPGPTYHYVTTQRRLMPWILEVTLAYLYSKDFDQDTALLSPDMLVFGSVAGCFRDDLGIVVRADAKHPEAQIFNGAQFFQVAAKARLRAFYRQALAIALRLPEDMLRWGADTEPLRRLLSPVMHGEYMRGGLRVFMIPHTSVMGSLSKMAIDRLNERPAVAKWPWLPLLDFRGPTRKQYLAAYYKATYGSMVAV